MATAVVSDTTHYLPRDLVAAHGIHLVSLYVNWQGRTDREVDMPDFDAYYAHLREATELPTTSQPSVGDFLEVYEPIIERGDDIVSVHLSAGISGTCQSAEQARAQLVERGVEGDRIVVLDSATACAGMGAVALAVARAANRGASAADAAEVGRRAREHLKIWFAVDTMEFLRRGGRVGAARAWIGSTLKVKPILTLEREITPVERVRTGTKAVERLVEHLQERREAGCDEFMVQHIQDPERALVLVERGREIYGTEPLLVSEIGPVIGTHIGPGLLGVAGVPSSALG